MKKALSALCMVLSIFFPWNAFARGTKESADAAGAPDYTDPNALERLIEDDGVPHVLVDVRTPEEYESGHIPTAVNIPYDEIAGNLPTEDRDELVVVYCRSGNRSGIAERTLRSLGFTNVVNFGGVNRWKKTLTRD